MASAYLLVSHGSRNPRPQIALQQLAGWVRQELTGGSSRTVLVETASLELAATPLHQQVEQFGRQVQAAGLKSLRILPLFLLPGTHVREDLPAEVARAQVCLGSDVQLNLLPHLGSYPGLSQLWARQWEPLPPQGRILLSHGSRRPGSNGAVEKLAAQWQALPAYWSALPSLAAQAAALVRAGQETITILPYFLFAGGIVESIGQQVQQLQQALPEVQLRFGQPLGATPELAQFIVSRSERGKECHRDR